MMDIKLNGHETRIEKGTTLAALLAKNGFLHKVGIAVALDSAVIPKAKWNETVLTTNDNVLVIAATKGG